MLRNNAAFRRNFQGFETRGTYLSNQRLALDNLIHVAAGKGDFKTKNKREVIPEELLQRSG